MCSKVQFRGIISSYGELLLSDGVRIFAFLAVTRDNDILVTRGTKLSLLIKRMRNVSCWVIFENVHFLKYVTLKGDCSLVFDDVV